MTARLLFRPLPQHADELLDPSRNPSLVRFEIAFVLLFGGSWTSPLGIEKGIRPYVAFAR